MCEENLKQQIENGHHSNGTWNLQKYGLFFSYRDKINLNMESVNFFYYKCIFCFSLGYNWKKWEELSYLRWSSNKEELLTIEILCCFLLKMTL